MTLPGHDLPPIWNGIQCLFVWSSMNLSGKKSSEFSQYVEFLKIPATSGYTSVPAGILKSSTKTSFSEWWGPPKPAYSKGTIILGWLS